MGVGVQDDVDDALISRGASRPNRTPATRVVRRHVRFPLAGKARKRGGRWGKRSVDSNRYKDVCPPTQLTNPRVVHLIADKKLNDFHPDILNTQNAR